MHNDNEAFARTAIASQKHCPLCGEVVVPSTKRCIRECVWPPVGTALGPRGAHAGSIARKPDGTSPSLDASNMDAKTLKTLVDGLRWAADDLTKALSRRGSHSPVESAAVAIDFRAFLSPATGPKTAQTCAEIDAILQRHCATDGRTLGFERIRRVRAVEGGKLANLWFYKFRFDGNQSQFIAATNQGSEMSHN